MEEKFIQHSLPRFHLVNVRYHNIMMTLSWYGIVTLSGPDPSLSLLSGPDPSLSLLAGPDDFLHRPSYSAVYGSVEASDANVKPPDPAIPSPALELFLGFP